MTVVNMTSIMTEISTAYLKQEADAVLQASLKIPAASPALSLLLSAKVASRCGKTAEHLSARYREQTECRPRRKVHKLH